MKILILTVLICAAFALAAPTARAQQIVAQPIPNAAIEREIVVPERVIVRLQQQIVLSREEIIVLQHEVIDLQRILLEKTANPAPQQSKKRRKTVNTILKLLDAADKTIRILFNLRRF